MNKHHQSTIRLRSTTAATVALLLLTAARPGVTPLQAAETGSRMIQASYVVSAVPETNPYSNRTQCVYRAWELAARAGHRLPYFGNAKEWRRGAINAGYTVVDRVDPSVVQSVVVWGGGVGGASWAGHVGWVVAVEGNRFLVQDRNWIPARDYEHWVTWVPGISFIVLGGAEAAPAAPTAPPPTATPAPIRVPPTPTPAPPTPTATPTPTEAPPTPAAGRRITTSPAGRSSRPIAAAAAGLRLSAPADHHWHRLNVDRRIGTLFSAAPAGTESEWLPYRAPLLSPAQEPTG